MVFHETCPIAAFVTVRACELTRATKTAFSTMNRRPTSAFVCGVPAMCRMHTNIAGGDEDPENVDHHGQRPGRRPHGERENDGVHDETEQPEARSDRAGHGEALDVFGEQIIGKPGRGGLLGRARQGRLHAGLDDFVLRVRHGCPVQGQAHGQLFSP